MSIFFVSWDVEGVRCPKPNEVVSKDFVAMSKNKLNKFHFPHATLLFCAAVSVAPPERPWISSDLGRAAGHLATRDHVTEAFAAFRCSDFIRFHPIRACFGMDGAGEACKAGSPLKVKQHPPFVVLLKHL